MEKQSSSFTFDSPDVITFLLKNFKLLATVTFIGAVVSIVVSLSIEPLFKSSATVFPASSSSISNDLLSSNLSRKDILRFGDEQEVEQMLQVLHSDVIRDAVVKKFKLMEHYDIDSAEAFPQTKLNRMYSKNIQFKRTQYQSVVIEVLDKDPQMAADIANSITQLFDTAMTKMKRDRALIALTLVEKEYHSALKNLGIMQDSLKQIQLLGINNYESQSEVFNDAYAQALLTSNTSRIKELEEKLALLSEYGGAYTSLRDQIIYETERISRLKAKYTEARIDYEHSLPHQFTIDVAVKAERKAKPVRWLIVSVSTFSTFLFSFLLLIILQGVGTRWKALVSKQ